MTNPDDAISVDAPYTKVEFRWARRRSLGDVHLGRPVCHKAGLSANLASFVCLLPLLRTISLHACASVNGVGHILALRSWCGYLQYSAR